MKKLISLLFAVAVFAAASFAQDNPVLTPWNMSAIPTFIDKPDLLALTGWKVEEVIKGDLNGDGRVDVAIKIAQIDPSKASGIGGDRVLVVALGAGDTWKRSAVTTKLLQCVGCGGAFYGVMPAPAGVTIEKGVLVVENEHGSRDVSTSTFRFRYNASSGRFALIGYDYIDRDRLTGNGWKESTNFATSTRVTTISKGKRTKTKRSVIKSTKIYIEDADGDTMEGEALHRLGLD